MYYFHSFVVAEISHENDSLRQKAHGEILIFRYAGALNPAMFVNRAYTHVEHVLEGAPAVVVVRTRIVFARRV